MQGTVPTKGNLMAAEKQLATARLGNDLMERKKTILQAEAAKREELCRALEAEVAAAPAWPGLAEGRRRAGAMAEAGPQAPPPPGTPSRHEKSLGLLTTKFVSLLQEAKDGVLDLKLVRPGLRGDRGMVDQA